jgi:hypothetical protein
MTVVNNGPETIPEESVESEATTTTTATTTSSAFARLRARLSKKNEN